MLGNVPERPARQSECSHRARARFGYDYTAFVAKVNDQMLKFQASDADAHQRVSGKLKGSHLEELILEPEFWFAWSGFHPGTAVFTAKNSSTR